MKKPNVICFVVLAGILLLASVLRLYSITTIPPALSWDEVSIGYNAYSIAKTGKDEHGKFLPLDTFIGYGDYKPPLSIYVTVPFVSMFGLNELAVRLPSALAGIFTVGVSYLLVVQMFGNLPLALLTSAVLAISPWHIQLSRAGFEANIAVFFVILGMYFLTKTRTIPKYWLIAFLPFVAAIYTFNSARYFVPLLGVGFFFWLGDSIRLQKKWFSFGSIIALVALLPIIPHLLSKEARLRFKEVNIFTDPSIVLISNERTSEDGGAFLGRMIHNRRVGYARSYLLHFMDHFDPQFLFTRGDGNPKFSIQDVGQLYVIEFPFLIAGIFFILSRYRKQGFLLLFWLIAAILPAAVARETPHALRIENGMLVFHIFIAAGILWFTTILRPKWLTSVFRVSIGLGYIFVLSYYLHNYYVHYPREFSGEWQYGYREAIAKIAPLKAQYKHIYLTESIGRPYMYVLFYEGVDPAMYLKEKVSYFDDAGFYHVTGFGQYRFVGNQLPPLEKDALYILPPGSVPDGARRIDTIHKLNGEPVLAIFDL